MKRLLVLFTATVALSCVVEPVDAVETESTGTNEEDLSLFCTFVPDGTSCMQGQGRCAQGACCTGCVDASGACKAGTGALACGYGGESCSPCIGGSCTYGVCVTTILTRPEPRFLQCLDDNAIIWMEHNSGSVYRAWLDGSGVTLVVNALVPFPQDMQVANGRILASRNGEAGFVASVPLDGSTAPVTTFASYPHQVAILGPTDVWINNSSIRTANDVLFGSIGAGRALNIDSDGFTWMDTASGTVMFSPAVGVAPVTIGTGTGFAYTSLSSDETYVFWSDSEGVHRWTKGGQVTKVSTAVAQYIEPLDLGYAVATSNQVIVNDEVVSGVIGPSGLTHCGGWLLWSTWGGQIKRAGIATL